MKKTSKIVMITLVLAILLLGVGYAAVQNITLTINGTAKADPSQSNFKVMFTGTPTVIDPTYVTAAQVTGDTSATITVKNLTTKGQKARVEYTITNASTDMSADLSVLTTNDNTDYFTLSSNLEKTSLTAGESTKVTVTVELTKTPVLEEGANANIKVSVEASPAEPGQGGSSGSTQTPDEEIFNDPNIFAFDASTGTITGINRRYMQNYYISMGGNEFGDFYQSPSVDTYKDHKYDNGYGGCILADSIDTLVVPSTINGVAVKNVQYLGAMNVRKIVFSEGIENIEGCYRIGEYSDPQFNSEQKYTDAFLLEEIVFPSTVKTIGEYAFSGCTKLTTLSLPGVVSLGNNAFNNCTELNTVTLSTALSTVGRETFSCCDKLTTINYSGTEEQYNYITNRLCPGDGLLRDCIIYYGQ